MADIRKERQDNYAIIPDTWDNGINLTRSIRAEFALRKDCRVVLIGHSFGGSGIIDTATALEAENTRVALAVLIDPVNNNASNLDFNSHALRGVPSVLSDSAKCDDLTVFFRREIPAMTMSGQIGKLVVAGTLGGVIASFIATSQLSPQLQAQVQQRKSNLGYERRVEILEQLPPVGTILAYASERDPPAGWTICDGKSVDEKSGFDQKSVDAKWWGKKVPDLKNRFLRGLGTNAKGEVEVIGSVGGSDSHEIPAHSHSLPASTGTIANGGADPGGGRYHVRDDGKHWDDHHHLAVDDGTHNGDQEGNHRHDLGGNTGEAGNLTISVIPSYVAVKYIIRVF